MKLDGESLAGVRIRRKEALFALATVLIVAVAAFSPSVLHWTHGLVLLLLALEVGILQPPVRFILKRIVLIEPVILAVGLAAVLLPTDRAIPWVIVVKANLCAVAVVLYSWVVPFHRTIYLLRALKFNHTLLTTLTLMHRYLPMLVEETRRMKRARHSRAFSTREMKSWTNIATVVAALLVRTIYRSERVYRALQARGWN